MRKKSYDTVINNNTITTDTAGLMQMLNCGRVTAVQIGMEAQAKIQINNPKVVKY